MRPLDGIVVLDLTRLLPGAATTTLPSQLGAEYQDRGTRAWRAGITDDEMNELKELRVIQE